MQKSACLVALLTTCFFAGACFAQSASERSRAKSLCSLQQTATEGDRETVVVSGVFGDGLDLGTLEDFACPKEGTWVELALRSPQNKEKLRKMLARSRRAFVVLEGEFYGPPVPDPKLPEAIRKSYHPGWGHLAAFRTKLVVHTILSVKAAPPDADKHKEPQTGTTLLHEGLHASEGERCQVPLFCRIGRNGAKDRAFV